MSRVIRFSSAAMGMVLLAGLAFYQGKVDISAGEEALMSGTALSETTASDCENTAGPEDKDTDTCAETDRTSGAN